MGWKHVDCKNDRHHRADNRNPGHARQPEARNLSTPSVLTFVFVKEPFGCKMLLFRGLSLRNDRRCCVGLVVWFVVIDVKTTKRRLW